MYRRIGLLLMCVALGACGDTDTDADMEPIEELGPAPPAAPAGAPMDTMPNDTTLPGDTVGPRS